MLIYSIIEIYLQATIRYSMLINVNGCSHVITNEPVRKREWRMVAIVTVVLSPFNQQLRIT